MKTFVRLAVALLAITAVCQARLAQAEDYYAGSGGSQSVSLTGDEKVAAAPQPACAQCDPNSCGSGCGSVCDPLAGIGCEEGPDVGVVGVFGLDSFKGISDGAFNSNFGVVTGVNAAAPLLGLGDRGIGWQVGLSYGIYDLDGRTTFDRAKSQTQTFVTTGFFRKAHDDQRVSFGLVYDWMYNEQWGQFANSPNLGQWRGQAEYALSGSNALGVWACQRDLGSIQSVNGFTVTDKALSQANVFWHHKFESGADSWLWMGVPDHGRIDTTQGGSLLDWTVGLNVQVPLSDRLALYGNASYGHPSAAAGATASTEQAYDVGMGVMWYFGRHAVSHSINGKCWTPYMPLANNSNFLVDEGHSANTNP